MKKEPEMAGPANTPVPNDMLIFGADGVYKKQCLCEYLRNLPEYPVVEAGETNRTASLPPSRYLPVGR
jgi:hypothetical protein